MWNKKHFSRAFSYQKLPQNLEWTFKGTNLATRIRAWCKCIYVSTFNADQKFSYFQIGSNEFKSGRLIHYIQQLQKVSEDKEVLEAIFGMKLNHQKIAIWNWTTKENKNSTEIKIKKLFSKGIIKKRGHKIGEYISPNFIWL